MNLEVYRKQSLFKGIISELSSNQRIAYIEELENMTVNYGIMQEENKEIRKALAKNKKVMREMRKNYIKELQALRENLYRTHNLPDGIENFEVRFFSVIEGLDKDVIEILN